jgi:streptogramin lyase
MHVLAPTVAVLAAIAPPLSRAQSPALLVTSRFTDQVLGYAAGGQFTGVFAAGGGLDNPVGATFGADGHLYVASANTNQVLRFHGTTGVPLGVLGAVPAPRNVNTGPDGTLYVCSGAAGQVVRFTTSGQSLGVFAQHPAIAGNTSLTFGPDFHLYVASVTNSQVVRFDGVTGAFLGVFASAGLSGAHDLSFGPDGHLYVSNAFTHDVVRLHGRTGALLGTFVSDPALAFPLGLAWGGNGELYVANQGGDDVRRYDGATGAALGTLVATGSGGLDGPLFVTFVHEPAGLRALATALAPAGQTSHLEVVGARPGGALLVGIGTLAGAIGLPCAGVTYGIGDPLVMAVDAADEGGRSVTRFFAPPAVAGMQFLLQAFDVSACTVGNVLGHTF